MKLYILPILILLTLPMAAAAQKPFSEGTIVYKVNLAPADNKEISGTYTFFIKGAQIRKEVSLSNGYKDVIIIDCNAGKVYSLQEKYGKKYAIELSMADMLKEQDEFAGYRLTEQGREKSFAGCSASLNKITYQNGTTNDIYITKEWQPVQAVTFERFPNAKFFPLYFSYTDKNKSSMQFEAERIMVGPIENALFRIPSDFKMISNQEYRELTR